MRPEFTDRASCLQDAGRDKGRKLGAITAHPGLPPRRGRACSRAFCRSVHRTACAALTVFAEYRRFRYEKTYLAQRILLKRMGELVPIQQKRGDARVQAANGC